MALSRAARATIIVGLSSAAFTTIYAYAAETTRRSAPVKTVASAAAKTRKVPARTFAPERQVAARWLRTMKLRDEVAQLIIVTTYGEAPPKRSKAFREYVHYVRDLRVGGLIVANRAVNGSIRAAEPYAMAVFLNRMQKLARVPLIVGADFERGASMRVADTTKFPHLMAYGAANDLQLTRDLGAATAREARALGVQWVFAPDADVNNNPDNPIINIRSFGEDPKAVSAQVQAFIEGAHLDPKRRVLVTAKHFPGHGDTATDTHIGLAKLEATRERMEQVEFEPFRGAIAAGVDAVMTAHMAVPALEPREIPATVSEPILTGVLRKDLKFEGLIVTDAMDMQGLAKQFSVGEASVRALEAGADVLLMPTDPDQVVSAIMQAVKQGRLTRKRIQQSALRVLAAKVRVGLHRSRLVDVEAVNDELDSPEAAEEAQRVADRAVTLVKNDNGVLPLTNPGDACLFVLSESRYSQQGRAMLAEAKRVAPDMRTVLLDPAVSALDIKDVVDRSSQCPKPVVAAFVTVGAYRGTVALNATFQPLMENLLASGKPVTLIALGSPYLLRAFPSVAAYLDTFSTVPASEAAAVRAVFGQITIRGRLPVSIPGFAKVGDGIDMPARAAQASGQ